MRTYRGKSEETAEIISSWMVQGIRDVERKMAERDKARK